MREQLARDVTLAGMSYRCACSGFKVKSTGVVIKFVMFRGPGITVSGPERCATSTCLRAPVAPPIRRCNVLESALVRRELLCLEATQPHAVVDVTALEKCCLEEEEEKKKKKNSTSLLRGFKGTVRVCLCSSWSLQECFLGSDVNLFVSSGSCGVSAEVAGMAPRVSHHVTSPLQHDAIQVWREVTSGCVCVARYSTWEPEDNILDPLLVLAYEEK